LIALLRSVAVSWKQHAQTENAALKVCAPGTTLKGIDVSKYQGTVDWPTVKNDAANTATFNSCGA